ncbi:MAG: serine protease, partial [Verrucomicrobiales bacterium]
MRRIIPLLMLFGTACPVLAGPMVHHIEWVTPRAGQQGTTVEVTLEGTFLKEAREVLFFRPGIRCTSLKVAPSLPEPRSTIHGGWVEDKVVCCFELAPDCPLGLHPFKVRTATELTTLATFAVTRFPIVEETAEDQPVAMNVSVLGRMDSNKVGDVDVYRLHGIAGQTLSVEIDSVRLTDKFYAESEFDLML